MCKVCPGQLRSITKGPFTRRHCLGTDRGHSALLPVGIKTPFLFYSHQFLDWRGQQLGGSEILSFPFKVCADQPSQTTAVIYSLWCWVDAGVVASNSSLLQGIPQAKSLAPGCGVPIWWTPLNKSWTPLYWRKGVRFGVSKASSVLLSGGHVGWPLSECKLTFLNGRPRFLTPTQTKSLRAAAARWAGQTCFERRWVGNRKARGVRLVTWAIWS